MWYTWQAALRSGGQEITDLKRKVLKSPWQIGNDVVYLISCSKEERGSKPVNGKRSSKNSKKTFKNLLTSAKRCDIIDKLLCERQWAVSEKITTGILKIEQYKTHNDPWRFAVFSNESGEQAKSDKTQKSTSNLRAIAMNWIDVKDGNVFDIQLY